MKKAILFSLLIVFSLCVVSVPQAALPPVEDLGADTIFPVEIDFGMFPPWPLPHCGDYCDTPGQERGCVDSSGPNWVRTFCTCIGNTWTC